MYFIDNIIINQMGFETNTHDHCIYRKIIDGELIFLLRQINDIAAAVHVKKT